MTSFYCSKSAHLALMLVVLMTLVLTPLTTRAQSGVSAQEQCFLNLKDNLLETGLFAEPLAQLGDRSYADIAPLFGAKKKMLTSFDLTIDEPNLGLRLYSFGEQTGYTHPPKSILPIYTESDTWGEPVKEYVLAEEYVTDPQGKEYFVNCLFLHIDSELPMAVTPDKYAYDGNSVSIVKTAPDGSYKAWYNQAPGFDYEDNHFVTWKRMIVYPVSTQNTYFNRFDVIDEYPANELESFDVLSFFLGKDVSFRVSQDIAPVATYTTVDAETQEVNEAKLPDELLPAPRNGINFGFSLASYYQAIEARFPTFAALLSLQGAIKYDTYRELVTKPDISEDEQQFTTLLFSENEELEAYYFAENKEANPEFDKLIELIENGDETMAKLAAGETLAQLTTPEAALLQGESSDSKRTLILAVLIAALGICILLFILERRKSKINHITV